jgi:hypothetical protein
MGKRARNESSRDGGAISKLTYVNSTLSEVCWQAVGGGCERLWVLSTMFFKLAGQTCNVVEACTGPCLCSFQSLCNLAIPAGWPFWTTSHHVPACRQDLIQTCHLTWLSHRYCKMIRGKRAAMYKIQSLDGDSCHRTPQNTAQTTLLTITPPLQSDYIKLCRRLQAPSSH